MPPRRTIPEIEALLSISDWYGAEPNERNDNDSWEAFRLALGLTYAELSLYKNNRFPPQGIAYDH
jgi:hypothetical protein